MNQPYYEHGTELIWTPGVPELDGIIVKVTGISTKGMAVLGVGYIIELPLALDHYHYTHCIAFDIHLKEL